MEELNAICDDGEMLDGLVKRFEDRVKKGMKFSPVLAGLEQAKAALDSRMNLVADAVGAVSIGELPDGFELRRRRRAAGLNLGQVAERLGVSVVTASRWETGDERPTVEQHKALTELFVATSTH